MKVVPKLGAPSRGRKRGRLQMWNSPIFAPASRGRREGGTSLCAPLCSSAGHARGGARRLGSNGREVGLYLLDEEQVGNQLLLVDEG